MTTEWSRPTFDNELVQTAYTKIVRTSEGRIEVPDFLQEKMREASDWYLLLDNRKIGDTVLTTAYSTSLFRTAEVLNSDRVAHGKQPITLHILVSDNFIELFDTTFKYLAATYSGAVNLIESPVKNTGPNDWNYLPDLNDHSSVLFDLRGYKSYPYSAHGLKPQPLYISQFDKSSSSSVLIANMLGNAVSWYSTNRMPALTATNRFDAFIADLTGVQLDGEESVPWVGLPENAPELLQAFKRDNLIEDTLPGIVISLETSDIQRKYDLYRWLKVAEHLQTNLPLYVLHRREQGIMGAIEAARLHWEIKRSSIANNTHLISGSLLDVAIFMSEQRAVIGNDSGPLHIAAAVGTPAVSLWSPQSPFAPQQWEHRLQSVSFNNHNKIWQIDPQDVAFRIQEKLNLER